MNKIFFRDLLDWYMEADPWTLDYEAEDRIAKELNKEAKRRGYKDWVGAFHEMKVKRNEVKPDVPKR